MECSPNNQRSMEIDKVMGALAKAQGSYKRLIPNQDGPHGRYANLAAVLEAVKESLSTNALCFYQYLELLDEGSGGTLLRSIVGHESGQWTSSSARVLSGKNERVTGSILEIARRRQASLILGIALSDTDPMAMDDDGVELVEQQLIEEVRNPKKKAAVQSDANYVISTDQYNELMIELQGYESIAKDILEVYGINTLADLPKDEYHKTRSRIMKVKKIEDEYNRKR